MLKRRGEVIAPKFADDELPDEQLESQGKLKTLFERVLKRPKKKWNNEQKRYVPMNKQIANFSKEDVTPELGKIEEDCLGLYKANGVEAYIVRTGWGVEYKKVMNPRPDNADPNQPVGWRLIPRHYPKYCCELFVNGKRKDAYFEEDMLLLVQGLKNEYPTKTDVPQPSEPITVVRRERAETTDSIVAA